MRLFGVMLVATLLIGCAATTLPDGESQLSEKQRKVLLDQVTAHLRKHDVPVDEDGFHFSEIAPIRIRENGECELDFCTVPSIAILSTYKNLSDITFVKDLPVPLVDINLSGTQVTDLSPLADTQVREVAASFTEVDDLSVLKGKPMTVLCFVDTKISDISIAQGMPLRNALFSGTKVSDISPLRGAPLTQLELHDTEVVDLSPVEGMQLTQIGLPDLEQIESGLDVVRQMDSLLVINGLEAGDYWEQVEVISKMWKLYRGSDDFKALRKRLKKGASYQDISALLGGSNHSTQDEGREYHEYIVKHPDGSTSGWIASMDEEGKLVKWSKD